MCHAYLDAFVLVIYTHRPAVRLITHTVSEGRCLNFNKVEQSDNQTPLRRATVSDSYYITLICNALESRSDSKSEKCLPLKLNEATRRVVWQLSKYLFKCYVPTTIKRFTISIFLCGDLFGLARVNSIKSWDALIILTSCVPNSYELDKIATRQLAISLAISKFANQWGCYCLSGREERNLKRHKFYGSFYLF